MPAIGTLSYATGAPPARNSVPGMSFKVGAESRRLTSSEVGAFQETVVYAFLIAES